MVACSICGQEGLTWSESADRKTGKSFLYNADMGLKHICTERVYCHECKKVFSTFEYGKRHLITNEGHRLTMWRSTDEQARSNSILLGVPEVIVKKK